MWNYLSRRRRILLSLPLASLLLLTASCSGSGTVSGTVYYKGEPLKVGMVQFFPENKGGDFSSPIKEDGTYSISKLPVGLVRVSIISNSVNPIQNMPPMAGGPFAKKGMVKAGEMMKKSKAEGDADTAPSPFDAKGKGVTTPAKYADPEKSGITLQVTGGTQKFDIKLD